MHAVWCKVKIAASELEMQELVVVITERYAWSILFSSGCVSSDLLQCPVKCFVSRVVYQCFANDGSVNNPIGTT